MKFSEFSAALRKDGSTFHVGDLVVDAWGEEFTGTGKINVENGSVRLEVILEGDQPLPPLDGTYSYDQFWTIAGIIDDHIPFWTKALPDNWVERSSRFKVLSSAFTMDRCHHLTSSLDGRSLRAAATASAAALSDPIDANSYMARLPGLKIAFCNEMTVTVTTNAYLGESQSSKRDTVRGSFNQFDYALIQEGEDCVVRVDAKPNAAVTKGDLQRITRELLEAIAFAHGQHSWPSEERFSGKGTTVEWARNGRKGPKAKYPPLTSTACHNGNSVVGMLDPVMRTYLEDSEFSKDLQNLMFLSREAGAKNMPHGTGTLGLCAVFEGLVRLLAKKFLVEADDVALETSFLSAKDTVRNHVESLISGTVGSVELTSLIRLRNLVGSASFRRPQDSFRRLVSHFALAPEKMEPGLMAWEAQRNIRAHGGAGDTSLEDLTHQGRIAGAINVLAACAVGFKGLMPLAYLENTYIRLK